MPDEAALKTTAKKYPQKGRTNNPKGRPKGVPNKLTADVKQMILAALDKAGGINYLFEQSAKNPTAFMSLVGKVLPMTLQGDPDKPVEHRVIVEIVGKNTNT